MAARMPMMATTIMSSISVKPLRFFFIFPPVRAAVRGASPRAAPKPGGPAPNLPRQAYGMAEEQDRCQPGPPPTCREGTGSCRGPADDPGQRVGPVTFLVTRAARPAAIRPAPKGQAATAPGAVPGAGSG